MKKLLNYWLPVMVWAVLIFILSSIPNLKTGLKEDYILRKIAHMVEFGILTFLLLRAIRLDKSAQGRSASGGKAIIFAVIIALFYALTDEYHQSFVFGRQCSFKDVGIDSIGILISAGLCYIKSR